MKTWISALFLIASTLQANAMPMENAPPPTGVLTLDAQASLDLPHDTVHLTLATEQEGNDPASISTALSKRVQQALTQAKAVAGINAQSGGFTIYPSNDGKGRIAAWRGRVELLIESQNFGAASQLAGQLASTMQLANVSFSLSREARDKVETQLAEQAIQAFRSKAQTAARAFGYGDYSIREVSINQQSGGMPFPRVYLAKAAMAEAAPVPLEGGKANVTVTVSGAVQMLKALP